LVAARTAAAKMGFIETAPETYGEDAQPGQRVQMEAEPGLFERLYPGEKMQLWDPQHPTTAFEPFSKTILKGVSAGLGVTYASLSHDLSEANYSSLRAGLLPERDHWRILQDYLIEHCHRVVFADWLSMAILTRRVKVGMRSTDTVQQVRWAPRGWEHVDPLNEKLAEENGIELGFFFNDTATTESNPDPGKDEPGGEATPDEPSAAQAKKGR